ncbi:MAG: pantoate kinase [Candidatus Thorarchaeota archaeon]
MKRALNPDKRTAQAYVPGHITCLFRIHDSHPDVLHRGSQGAGFSVEMGTLTTITVSEQAKPRLKIAYNGRKLQAKVTKTVVEKLTEDYGLTLDVNINHQSDLPIGVGFGASGAGALGTALALGHLIDQNMDYNSAAQYAHEAEVINHTGLGDVIAQTLGGLEIRLAPGAPGIGKAINVTYPEDISVVLSGATSLETKSVLTNPAARELVNKAGDRLIKSIMEHPSLESIVSSSIDFADAIGLESPRIRSALSDLKSSGYNMSSMVMLGDSVYCLCDENEVPNVVSILRTYWNESEVFVTKISNQGGVLC